MDACMSLSTCSKIAVVSRVSEVVIHMNIGCFLLYSRKMKSKQHTSENTYTAFKAVC